MKLQQGDYVTDLTKEQFDELIMIENHVLVMGYTNDKEDNEYYFANGICYSHTELLDYSDKKICKTLLSFTEFKQRAINTFER